MNVCKVVKNNLSKFLDLLSLKGELENKTILLHITDGSMKAPFILTESKVLAIRGSFKDENLTKLGEICINDTRLLKSFINTFSSKEITLAKKTNKLVLSSSKESLKISVVLRNPQYIKDSLPKGKSFDDTLKLISDNTFTLTKEQIDRITKNTSVINAKDLILEGKDNKVILNLESNENQLSEEFKISEKIEPFKIKLNSFIIDLLSIIDEDVIMSAKDNSAIYIVVKNECYEVEYVLASLKVD